MKCRNCEWRRSRAVLPVWVSLVLERKHLCTAAEGLELNCSLQAKIPAKVCKAPWQRYLGTGAAKRSSQLGPAALLMGEQQPNKSLNLSRLLHLLYMLTWLPSPFPLFKWFSFCTLGWEANRASSLLHGYGWNPVHLVQHTQEVSSRQLNTGSPGHRLMLKQMDYSSPKLSLLFLPHLLRHLHSVCVCRQFYFVSGLEMKVALSKRTGMSAHGNPELHRVCLWDPVLFIWKLD